MPTKVGQNFEMWSGDHRNVTFTVTDASSASVNLAGASVVFALSVRSGGASLIRLTNESGSGITVSGCTFTVSLSPTHTSGLAGTYFHESQVRDSGGNISTVATGWVDIKPDTATNS